MACKDFSKFNLGLYGHGCKLCYCIAYRNPALNDRCVPNGEGGIEATCEKRQRPRGIERSSVTSIRAALRHGNWIVVVSPAVIRTGTVLTTLPLFPSTDRMYDPGGIVG